MAAGTTTTGLHTSTTYHSSTSHTGSQTGSRTESQTVPPSRTSHTETETDVSSSATTNVEIGPCANLTNCADCTKKSCLWCGGQTKCISGAWYGPQQADHCTDWYSKQCVVDGEYLGYGAIGGGVLLLLLCIFCCCLMRCCMKKKRRNYKVLENEHTSLLIQTDEPETKHPKTDALRANLTEKYGHLMGREVDAASVQPPPYGGFDPLKRRSKY
eukprot:TRINITY_DN3327_c0_g1_i1.p1 TRINITY_DN3327_c0_g1~~TRINITY_DN3327_c0_g1_i1.p1  ORF type:complete len:231 (+),score=34.02 TRINITY_DN3327_c0_g1_i1:52-693(+)